MLQEGGQDLTTKGVIVPFTKRSDPVRQKAPNYSHQSNIYQTEPKTPINMHARAFQCKARHSQRPLQLDSDDLWNQEGKHSNALKG